MKTLFLTPILFFLAINVYAQEVNKPKSLFKSPETKYGIADAYFYSANYDGNLVNGGGFNAAAVFTNNITAGIGFNMTQTKKVDFPNLTQAILPRFTTFSFTSNFEYLILPDKVINFSIPLNIGVGYSSYRDRNIIETTNYNNNSTRYKLIEDDFFFIAEPGINMFVNLFDWMSLKVGGSYRFIAGASELGSNNAFSGYALNAGVRFKIFE